MSTPIVNITRGKREAHKKSFTMKPEKAAHINDRSILRTTGWPCGGRLSAVNAIGTQLRGLINSGMTR